MTDEKEQVRLQARPACTSQASPKRQVFCVGERLEMAKNQAWATTIVAPDSAGSVTTGGRIKPTFSASSAASQAVEKSRQKRSAVGIPPRDRREAITSPSDRARATRFEARQSTRPRRKVQHGLLILLGTQPSRDTAVRLRVRAHVCVRTRARVRARHVRASACARAHTHTRACLCVCPCVCGDSRFRRRSSSHRL